MSAALRKRVARLERTCQVERDWRQFGDDPRDMPGWALVAAILWHYEQVPELSDNPDLKEARRLYDAGEIDAASNLLDLHMLDRHLLDDPNGCGPRQR